MEFRLTFLYFLSELPEKIDNAEGLDASLIYQSFKTQLHHFICHFEEISHIIIIIIIILFAKLTSYIKNILDTTLSMCIRTNQHSSII